jgi:hypothetical protein
MDHFSGCAIPDLALALARRLAQDPAVQRSVFELMPLGASVGCDTTSAFHIEADVHMDFDHSSMHRSGRCEAHRTIIRRVFLKDCSDIVLIEGPTSHQRVVTHGATVVAMTA